MKKPVLVLIHDWSFKKYSNMTNSNDVWDTHSEFFKYLEKKFEIVTFNFPGFCKSQELDGSWNLDNYADFVEELLGSKNIKPDIVLGYSFGGAVGVRWKKRFNKDTKLFLVSPAIKRKYKRKISTKFFKMIFPRWFILRYRDLYLRYIVKNYDYVESSTHMRASYLNIIAEDVSEELQQTNALRVKIIFGSKDIITPPTYLINALGEQWSSAISVVEGGDHDLIRTHGKLIASNIVKFMQ